MTVETTEDRLAHYRRMADEARSRAGRTADVESRVAWMEMAEAWDRLFDLERKLSRQL